MAQFASVLQPFPASVVDVMSPQPAAKASVAAAVSHSPRLIPVIYRYPSSFLSEASESPLQAGGTITIDRPKSIDVAAADANRGPHFTQSSKELWSGCTAAHQLTRQRAQNLNGKVIGSPCFLCLGKAMPLMSVPTQVAIGVPLNSSEATVTFEVRPLV